jgi:hypothetical protein
MANIYITQIPNKRDADTGTFVPTVNVNPAKEHGELIVMMPSFSSFHSSQDLVKQMEEKLKDYDYDAGDMIMALGDPAIIAVAFAIIGKTRSKFTILKWDRIVKRYLPTKIVIN